VERVGDRLLSALWVGFAAASLGTWQRTGCPLYLGWLTLNLVTAVLFWIRRSPRRLAPLGPAWGWAIVGTSLPFGLSAPARMTGPAWILAVSGVALALWGLVSLGRSFGVVAADRGRRIGGAYRFLAHPIYLGEVGMFTGVAIASPIPRNLAILTALACVQWMRAREEAGFHGNPVRFRWKDLVSTQV